MQQRRLNAIQRRLAQRMRKRGLAAPRARVLLPAPASPASEQRVPALGIVADACGNGTAILHLLRQQTRHWAAFIGCIDALLLVLAVTIAVRVRYFIDAASYTAAVERLSWRAGIFAAAIVLCLFALGLYRTQAREIRGLLIRQMVGFALGGLLLMILYYAMPQAYIGRGVTVLALVAGYALIAAWHLLIAKIMDAQVCKRRILVLGTGHQAAYLLQRMGEESARQTFQIVGYVPVSGEATRIPHSKLLYVDADLRVWATRRQIDEIVVVPDDGRGALPMDALLECKQHGIEVTNLVRFLERESGKVRLDTPPSWLVFSRGFHASPLRRACKRLFDILSAVSILAGTWPVMLCVAAAIRLGSGTGQPILYAQERVGEHGRIFRLYKFRSMRTDAEAGGVARWASTNDERVTRIGRIIRRLRLDELPQLWNVLNGTMSFIGPRPERPQFVTELAKSIPYYTLRHCVKPGMSGWAQLRYRYGSSVEDAAEKLTFDLFYVKNHSLWFDLRIFLQTVEIVLFGRGAR
jgi:sugar transferase (PEP-CTERM system associated)